ncbi:MAG: DUF2062 domain-containing protein [Psychromonas sp.]
MPKKFLKRFIPKTETLKAHPHLRHFGETLHNPNLWHLNRRSAAGAVAVGLFCAWIPIPFQMLLAATGAILFSVNLPISVALVWISNPLTMGPFIYGAYRLGAFLLHLPAQHFHFELSYSWLSATFTTIAPPLFLGSLLLGSACAFLGYLLFRVFWRFAIIKKWQRRNKK